MHMSRLPSHTGDTRPDPLAVASYLHMQQITLTCDTGSTTLSGSGTARDIFGVTHPVTFDARWTGMPEDVHHINPSGKHAQCDRLARHSARRPSLEAHPGGRKSRIAVKAGNDLSRLPHSGPFTGPDPSVWPGSVGMSDSWKLRIAASSRIAAPRRSLRHAEPDTPPEPVQDGQLVTVNGTTAVLEVCNPHRVTDQPTGFKGRTARRSSAPP